MTVFVASDVHLGWEYTDYGAFEEFLGLVQKEATELYLCGDTFDLWRSTISEIGSNCRHTYTKLLETSKKIPTLVIPGNHDHNLRKYHLPLYVTDNFVDNNILYCHGWEFHVEMAVAHPFFSTIIETFPYIYQRFFKMPSAHLDRENTISPDIHQVAENYAITKGYDYVVMGHTHCELCGDPVYPHVVDCGDFQDSRTYVTVDNSKPKLHYL